MSLLSGDLIGALYKQAGGLSYYSSPSVARFGLFGPNWSFQTSFGPQKLHLVFGLILVFLGHSDWSFGPFWSFF